MTTQTEAHLSVIAEKIEAIQNIDADVGGNAPSFLQRKSAIPHLKIIGKSVSHIPEEFKNRQIRGTWQTMEVWGDRRYLSVGSLTRHWEGIVELLREIEPNIHRHTGGDTEIQKEIISDMREQYVNLLQIRREQKVFPYLLIFISSILIPVVLQLRSEEMDYNALEIIAYISHISVILSIPIYLLNSAANLRPFDNPQYLYYTFCENYYVLYLQLATQIDGLKYISGKAIRNITLITFLWLYTLVFVIFVILGYR